MRQRKIKNIDEKLMELSYLIVDNPEAIKGKWRKLFAAWAGEDCAARAGEACTARTGEDCDTCAADAAGKSRDLYLEVGCGKGRFIKSMAEAHPEGVFVAAEGLASVVYRAITKVHEAGITNVRFVTDYVERLDAWFEEGELSGIFLNFSDPWPKARHSKRRLTYGGRLAQYSKAIEVGGFIRFKTDNDNLFSFTIEQIEEIGEECGLEVTGLTRDLHNSEYRWDSPMTEYEEKFSNQGKNINYVELRKK